MADAIGHRLLHPGKHLWLRGGRGVLRLMFRCGNGVTTVYDRDYGAERTFHCWPASVNAVWTSQARFWLDGAKELRIRCG